MVDIAQLVKFSGKTEEEVKVDIREGLENPVLKSNAIMKDDQKLSFVMNSLFAKYSKKHFQTGSGADINGAFIGIYQKSDNSDYMIKSIKKFVEEQPDEAKKLCMVDNDGNYLFYETQDKFAELEDWQIKKRFIRFNEEYILKTPSIKGMMPVLNRNGVPFIGLPIPAHDYVRYAHGVELKEDGTTVPFILKIAGDNTSKELPLYQVGVFKVYKVASMSSETSSYYTASGALDFKFVRNLEDAEIEQFINKNKVYTLNEFSTLDGITSRNSFAVFKVRVQDCTMLENGGYVLKVYDDTIQLGEDDEQGNKIVPYTVYPQEGFSPTFSDGAEIYVLGNPYTSQKGVKTISACSIYVPEIYRNLVKETTKNIDL